MTTAGPVLVTGAAGKTGRAVTRALAERGVPVRAMVRPGSAHRPPDGAAEVVEADLRDPAALAKALDGVSGSYLICPNLEPDETRIVAGFLDAAAASGVRRVVYHSVLRPDARSMPHHAAKADAEALLLVSRLEWTVLQPASYLDNLSALIRRGTGQWTVELPYSADTPFTPVALTDVAAVAARVLTEAGHDGARYELAGPQRLSHRQIAGVVAAVAGVTVHVRQVRPPAGDDYRALALRAMFDYYDRHGLCGGGFLLRSLLPHAPHTVETWARQNLVG